MSFFSRSFYSAVAVAGFSLPLSSFRRSGRTSARCSALTSAWPARVSARMPPHQPVPTTATSIGFMRISSRVHLDVGFLDQLRILVHLGADEGRELRGRAALRLDAEIREALLRVHVGE